MGVLWGIGRYVNQTGCRGVRYLKPLDLGDWIVPQSRYTPVKGLPVKCPYKSRLVVSVLIGVTKDSAIIVTSKVLSKCHNLWCPDSGVG